MSLNELNKSPQGEESEPRGRINLSILLGGGCAVITSGILALLGCLALNSCLKGEIIYKGKINNQEIEYSESMIENRMTVKKGKNVYKLIDLNGDKIDSTNFENQKLEKILIFSEEDKTERVYNNYSHLGGDELGYTCELYFEGNFKAGEEHAREIFEKGNTFFNKMRKYLRNESGSKLFNKLQEVNKCNEEILKRQNEIIGYAKKVEEEFPTYDKTE
jgi:hypothetical protein